MMQFDATLEMAKARQKDLRAQARQQRFTPSPGPNVVTARQRFGRALVRFGQWLDDCRPEVLPESSVATS